MINSATSSLAAGILGYALGRANTKDGTGAGDGGTGVGNTGTVVAINGSIAPSKLEAYLIDRQLDEQGVFALAEGSGSIGLLTTPTDAPLLVTDVGWVRPDTNREHYFAGMTIDGHCQFKVEIHGRNSDGDDIYYADANISVQFPQILHTMDVLSEFPFFGQSLYIFGAPIFDRSLDPALLAGTELPLMVQAPFQLGEPSIATLSRPSKNAATLAWLQLMANETDMTLPQLMKEGHLDFDKLVAYLSMGTVGSSTALSLMDGAVAAALAEKRNDTLYSDSYVQVQYTGDFVHQVLLTMYSLQGELDAGLNTPGVQFMGNLTVLQDLCRRNDAAGDPPLAKIGNVSLLTTDNFLGCGVGAAFSAWVLEEPS